MSGDGRYIATSSKCGGPLLWSTDMPNTSTQFDKAGSPVTVAVPLADSVRGLTSLVACGEDGVVRTWQASCKRQTLSKHELQEFGEAERVGGREWGFVSS
jgi:hypothetical protein